MKAIITVIDDDGKVLVKDKIIEQSAEYIDEMDTITVKTTYFNFKIKRLFDAYLNGGIING